MADFKFSKLKHLQPSSDREIVALF